MPPTRPPATGSSPPSGSQPPIAQIVGHVRDEDGTPWPGLTVYLDDGDVLATQLAGAVPADEHAPYDTTATNDDGAFTLDVPPSDMLRVLGIPRHLAVLVCDRLGVRELARVDIGLDPEWAGREPPPLDIVIARGVVTGWLATGQTPHPFALSTGNEIDIVIDGEAGFRCLLEAIRNAKDEVLVQQLLWDPPFKATVDEALLEQVERLAEVLDDADAPGTLAAELAKAAQRGVDARVLLNQNFLIPDSVDEVRQYFATRAEGLVHVRRYPLSPGVMHAKTVIIDQQEAFIIGPPFEQKYWDTRRHRVDEPRRGENHPLHDAFLHVRGPAVAHVRSHFARLWQERAVRDDKPDPAGARLADAGVAPMPAARRGAAPADAPKGIVARSGQSVQILETLPEQTLAGPARHGILEAYLRAISNARSCIYAETQYFTSGTISRALARALETHPDLEVILLLNETMDIPSYDTWQDRRLEAMGHPHHPRLGVFSLWSSGTRHESQRGVRACYVHTKIAIVDDMWATLGCANLDGIGLESAREFGFRAHRSVELNAAFPDGVDGQPATGIARALRMELWHEHLGIEPEHLQMPPRTGWLRLWRDTAARNLQDLVEGRLPASPVCILPHHPRLPPEARFPD